jgi:hypothetical protein
MKPTLFFLDGVSIGPDNVALAGQYNEYPDVDASRVLLFIDGVWTSVDFDEDVIRSLAFEQGKGTLYLLGTSGHVYTIGGKSREFTRGTIKGTLKKVAVVDPEIRGELFRIRAISSRVFACGQGGQLYECLGGSWESLGYQGEALSCPDFEDVTVSSDGVPLAVGLKGAIVRFERDGPRLVDSPTNQHFSCISQAPNGAFYICGNNGVVFKFDKTGFTDLTTNVTPIRNLWAIVSHGENIYACEPGRLLVLKPNEDWAVEPVSELKKPSFSRLSSTGSQLWAVGPDHVFVNCKGSWDQLLIPGNDIPL